MQAQHGNHVGAPGHDLESPLKAAPEKRSLDILIDESSFPQASLALAGAATFDHKWRLESDRQIAVLQTELAEDFYLDQTRAYDKNLKNGFHATDDSVDIRGRFISLASRIKGVRFFMAISDGTGRPRIETSEGFALLELRLCEVILRKFSYYEVVNFIFEQNQSLQSHFEKIVEVAARRTGFAGVASTTLAKKNDPPSLALIDYALYYYGLSQTRELTEWEQAHWRALRPMLSVALPLEPGHLPTRRGLN